MRQELGIDEGTGFWVFSVSDEGILLKLVETPDLENSEAMEEIRQKADKIKIKPKNLDKTVKKYKKKSSNLEDI